jgi:UDP-glucose 4-epimerase
VYGKNPKERWREDDDMVLGPTSRARWAYGCSKAIDEFLALAYHQQVGLPVVIGRFFNVIGPRQVGHYGMVVPRFVDQALAGGPVVVYDDGRQVRCFAHVKDVVRAIVELVRCDAAVGGVFNIGSDVPVTIRELAEKVVAMVDSAVAIEHVPYDEAYGEGFEDVRRRVPDLTRLERAIAFRPQYRLEDAIAEIVRWKRCRAGAVAPSTASASGRERP